jgi:hypothetical protein
MRQIDANLLLLRVLYQQNCTQKLQRRSDARRLSNGRLNWTCDERDLGIANHARCLKVRCLKIDPRRTAPECPKT